MPQDSDLLRSVLLSNNPKLPLSLHPSRWTHEQLSILKCKEPVQSTVPATSAVARGVRIEPRKYQSAYSDYKSIRRSQWPSWSSILGSLAFESLIEAFEIYIPETDCFLSLFSVSRKNNTVQFSYGIGIDDQSTLHYRFSVQLETHECPIVAVLDVQTYRSCRASHGGDWLNIAWQEDPSLYAYCVAILMGLAQEFAAKTTNTESESKEPKAYQMIHLIVLSNVNFDAVLYTAKIKSSFLTRLTDGTSHLKSGGITIIKQKASINSLWGMIDMMKHVWDVSTEINVSIPLTSKQSAAGTEGCPSANTLEIMQVPSKPSLIQRISAAIKISATKKPTEAQMQLRQRYNKLKRMSWLKGRMMMEKRFWDFHGEGNGA